MTFNAILMPQKELMMGRKLVGAVRASEWM